MDWETEMVTKGFPFFFFFEIVGTHRQTSQTTKHNITTKSEQTNNILSEKRKTTDFLVVSPWSPAHGGGHPEN